jgi:hypothetical protein
VRSHHWNFGDMPPQPQVTPQQLADIVAYVRVLQEANGIFHEPHVNGHVVLIEKSCQARLAPHGSC